MWTWHYIQQKNLLVDAKGEIFAEVVRYSDLLYYMTSRLYPEHKRQFIDLDSAKKAAEGVAAAART